MARMNHFLVIVVVSFEYHVFLHLHFWCTHRRDTRRRLSADANLTICCVGGDEKSVEASYA